MHIDAGVLQPLYSLNLVVAVMFPSKFSSETVTVTVKLLFIASSPSIISSIILLLPVYVFLLVTTGGPGLVVSSISIV